MFGSDTDSKFITFTGNNIVSSKINIGRDIIFQKQRVEESKLETMRKDSAKQSSIHIPSGENDFVSENQRFGDSLKGTIEFGSQDLLKKSKRGSFYPSSPKLCNKPFDRRATQHDDSLTGLKVGREIEVE
jgi:hypothetical protein